ncbi:MAG TPA: hypothetical protein PL193_15310 [Xanthobacteraceae bacterium]|nr:hypothetical protein [Xanthobacteraceae bacterium]
MIEFELPLEVDSFEQCVALIARCIGYGVKPDKPAPRLAIGERWRDRLPAGLR